MFFSGAASCGEGFAYQNGDICYSYMTDVKTWTDADTVCTLLGGYMAEVRTEEQNRYIEGILYERASGNNVWLGATDQVTEGSWYWATSDTTLSFSYWGDGQPGSGRGGNCLMFSDHDKHWADGDCGVKLPFICQRHVDAVVVG